MKAGIAYFGTRMPKHVARDLSDIVAHGCTYVVHTFSESDRIFYRGTMREIFELTRRAGLEVWVDPWGVGHTFGGEAFSAWVAKYPEFCQRDAAGRHIPAACLNQPPFRDFLHAWVDAALELGPDMVFWDELHLFVGAWQGEPDRWSCLCDVCRDLYRQRYGGVMPTVRTDPSVQAFRAWSVLDFLTDVIGYAHDHGAKNALRLYPEQVMPDPGPAWADIARIPGLDNLGTDPYPFTNSFRYPPEEDYWRPFVERNVNQIVRLTRDRNLQSHFWLQAFKLPAEGVDYVEQAARLAVEAGITNLAAWGYEACAHMSSIACEDPAAVWETIGRIYRSLRGE
jgi:hypothetical protein